MSLKENLGKIAGKAKVVAEKSGDKIASGVDKATDKIDKKTGGKYHDKLEKVDKLTAKLDKKEDADKEDTDQEAVTGETPVVVVDEAPRADEKPAAEPPTGILPS